jgi:hypothetical protein
MATGPTCSASPPPLFHAGLRRQTALASATPLPAPDPAAYTRRLAPIRTPLPLWNPSLISSFLWFLPCPRATTPSSAHHGTSCPPTLSEPSSSAEIPLRRRRPPPHGEPTPRVIFPLNRLVAHLPYPSSMLQEPPSNADDLRTALPATKCCRVDHLSSPRRCLAAWWALRPPPLAPRDCLLPLILLPVEPPHLGRCAPAGCLTAVSARRAVTTPSVWAHGPVRPIWPLCQTITTRS